MRRAVETTGILALGMLLGGLVVNHVWIVESELDPLVVRGLYSHEQERLRGRAGRAGDDVEVLLRSLNIADAKAGTGFRWLTRAGNLTYRERSASPWSTAMLLAAGRFDSDAEKQAKGGAILAAMSRGRAALAFERLGLPEAADEQWRVAGELVPDWSPARVREVAESSERWDDGPLIQLLDDAYLESATFAELHEMLDGGLDDLLDSDGRAEAIR